MSEEEKENLQKLLLEFRAYSPNLLMAGDGSFRWASGNYASPYEVLKGIHDANAVIERLVIEIDAIDVAEEIVVAHNEQAEQAATRHDKYSSLVEGGLAERPVSGK